MTADASKDADIAGFAAKTLPTLQQPQQMATSRDSRVKGASAGTHATTR
jgi:hypothetical protein